MNIRRFVPKSISTRIGLVIVATVVFTTIAQYVAISGAITRLGFAVEQQVFWEVATLLAERLQPHTSPRLDSETVQRTLYDFYEANPNLGLFILDSEGRIIFQQSGSERIFALELPIDQLEKALSKSAPPLPIYARDPRSALGQEVTFSVARLQLGSVENADPNSRPLSNSGYVFVTFKGLAARLLAQRGQFVLTQLAVFSILIIAFIASALSLLLFYALTKKFREVVSVLREFEEGNFLRRVPEFEENELRSVSVAINSLADSVVTATSALEERDAARRALVANISHDLRSPVGALQLHLDLVEESIEADKPLSIPSDISPMQRSLSLLQRLVADLFELTKLETKQQFIESEIPIFELLTVLSQRYQPFAMQQSVDMRLDAEQVRGVRLIGDESLIERLLVNLIENALRYSPPHSTLQIMGHKTDTSLLLAIHDQGGGIAEPQRQKMFERGVAENYSPGAGLGLALCQLIAKLHEGRLEYQFDSSRGSTITAILPLKREQSPIRE